MLSHTAWKVGKEKTTGGQRTRVDQETRPPSARGSSASVLTDSKGTQGSLSSLCPYVAAACCQSVPSRTVYENHSYIEGEMQELHTGFLGQW